MRKVGAKGAPTASAFKQAAKTAKPVAQEAWGNQSRRASHRMPDGTIMKDSAHKGRNTTKRGK
jgi:hypothetical protein